MEQSSRRYIDTVYYQKFQDTPRLPGLLEMVCFFYIGDFEAFPVFQE